VNGAHQLSILRRREDIIALPFSDLRTELEPIVQGFSVSYPFTKYNFNQGDFSSYIFSIRIWGLHNQTDRLLKNQQTSVIKHNQIIFNSEIKFNSFLDKKQRYWFSTVELHFWRRKWHIIIDHDRNIVLCFEFFFQYEIFDSITKDTLLPKLSRWYTSNFLSVSLHSYL